MSYFALVTDNYDEVIRFYQQKLAFPIIEKWDRHNARGTRFKMDDLKLEILDNSIKKEKLELFKPGDRFHLVIEVDKIEESYERLKDIALTPPVSTSWNATLFQVIDPDGINISYLSWKNELIG
ncbi:VOC family protein [Flammeovirga pectinis]|uniref:VOC family protein n=1 Tax=Flammeovirga pectinis TaxID=2494373 RepID=A0A3Q9FMW3_9BACT|nr:VOC family protein [Flammeovirga pectinis]AZQ63785.1 VOC family protein [Flammeovirga pectinis]